ncbi:hypothetical protein GCM10009554_29090 [Kribbella koreensis]|uniref:Uncharacterized protein n=1 Tax=Kribbella koreensis TaxID=57909 RepID=A0ABN1Q9U4_9ACTN
MSHRPAPAPSLDRRLDQPHRRRWPFVCVVAVLVVLAVVAVFAIRRDDSAVGAESRTAPLVLVDGVTAGGRLSGQARTLADALAQHGLDCSVRFTGADGGQTGCFAGRQIRGTTVEAVFQHQPDGTVIGLDIKVNGPRDTAQTIRALLDSVGTIVFPADLPKLIDITQRAFAGFPDGTWGTYVIVGHGKKTSLSASKVDTTPIKVPVLHLDTTEPALADALRADGFSCTADNETCAAQPGMTLKFSGPDEGITYLVATAATGPTSQETFAQLADKLFGHLSGSAVQPMRDWLTKHLDGNSHSAYVAGWRADFEVTTGKQLRLTLFNEERWLIPG